MSELSKISVVVVDDSAFMRKIIGEIMEAHPDIELLGSARDGFDAIDKIKKLKPDVVTMDIEMPRLDGIKALEIIMRETPLPVVMLSSLTQLGSKHTLKALELGAVDFIGKPSGQLSLDIKKIGNEITKKVMQAAGSRPRRRIEPAVAKEPKKPEASLRAERIIAIASSTGGPQALCQVLPGIETDERTSIAIVQHMPAYFTKSLADRLSSLSSFNVREAVEGDRIAGNCAFVAPGGFHLEINSKGDASLMNGPPVHSVKPSADVLFASVARHFGGKALGVVLTGMGIDGAYGLKTIKDAGGWTIAQNKETSVVFGMPKAAIDSNAAQEVLPLEEISERINRWING